MMRINFHNLVVVVLGGLLGFTLTTGSGCGLVVKYVAGQAVKKVAKSAYESVKTEHERKSRAGKQKSRDHDAQGSQPQPGDSKDNAASDAEQTGLETE